MFLRFFAIQLALAGTVYGQSFEVIRPTEYSVDRFQEVISAHLEDHPENNRDTLIGLRAKLAIAERTVDSLKKKREEALTPKLREEAPKVIHIRAAQARVDHYRKKLRELESSLSKTRRKK